MALDFPTPSNTGEIHTENGYRFVWDGSKWQSQQASSAYNLQIVTGNTKAEVVDTGSDGHFKVTTEGTERLRIDSSGNVGIGTTSPASYDGNSNNLVIANTGGNAGLTIATSTSGDGTISWADGTSGNERYRGTIGYNHTNDKFTISTAASSALTIDSSGNCGIGTTSPSQKLHVNGTAYVADDHIRLLLDSGNGRLQIRSSSDTTNVDIYGSNGQAYFAGNVGIGSSSLFSATGYGTLNLSGSTGGALAFSEGSTKRFEIYGDNTNGLRVYDRTNTTERLRIDNSGRLCLGTTSSNVLSTFALSSTNAYSTTGNLDNSNVGLRLYNSNGSDGTGASNYIGIQLNVGSGATSSGSLAYVRTADNQGAFVFNQRTGASSYAEAMRIDSSGKVGIGVTSPDSSLHVDGNAKFLRTDAQNLFVCENQADNADGTLFDIRKSRGGTSGPSQITAGDVLGSFRIRGYNGTTFTSGFVIKSTSTTNTGNLAPNTEFINNGDTVINLQGSTGILINKDIYSTTSFGEGSNGFRFKTAGLHQVARDTGASSNVFQALGNSGQLRVKGDGDCENTNNRYGQISDSKLKENIVDANSQWDDIKAVQVRNFNFKADTGWGTHTQIGVIAQELETVSPGLVKNNVDEDADGNDLGTVTKSVSYSVLYMKAIKALQEAMTRIETLETKVAALEAE